MWFVAFLTKLTKLKDVGEAWRRVFLQTFSGRSVDPSRSQFIRLEKTQLELAPRPPTSAEAEEAETDSVDSGEFVSVCGLNKKN